MKRVTIAMLAVLFLMPVVGVAMVRAQVGAEEEPVTSGATGLSNLAAADTVRSNLWLVEALLSELMTDAARALPPAPAAVRLVQLGDDPQDELGRLVASRVLRGMDYDVYLSEADPDLDETVDFIYRFRVQDVDLAYPQTGRTLGIWRRWVSRQVQVTALIEIHEAASGQLIYGERRRRTVQDRVGNDHLPLVDSDIYPFTTAATAASGWQDRVESFVVLGTLAGLVAVYFANTGE